MAADSEEDYSSEELTSDEEVSLQKHSWLLVQVTLASATSVGVL